MKLEVKKSIQVYKGGKAVRVMRRGDTTEARKFRDGYKLPSGEFIRDDGVVVVYEDNKTFIERIRNGLHKIITIGKHRV